MVVRKSTFLVENKMFSPTYFWSARNYKNFTRSPFLDNDSEAAMIKKDRLMKYPPFLGRPLWNNDQKGEKD